MHRQKGRGRGLELTLSNSAGALYCLGLSNAVETDERGWTVLPFGMFAHSQGFQRFGMKEAEAIVETFKSACGRLKRAIVGLPVYKGHPDDPAFSNKYRDKTEYGQVADMEVRDNGLAIRHVLSNAGAAIVSKLGIDRISPRWKVAPTGEMKEGRPVYAPTSIVSVGLVTEPNIPNLSLSNESQDTMKDKLIALLASNGITLANDSTDDQVVAAFTDFSKRPKTEDFDRARNDLAIANSKVTTLTAERDSEKARADAGATALANERTTATKGVLDEAIKSGKIAAADRPAWEKVLSNDFESGRKVLTSMQSKVKTKEQVKTETAAELDKRARSEFSNADDGADAGADGNDSMANHGAKIQKLVNEEMKALDGCGMKGNALRNKAWANVKKRMPKLFGPLAHGPGEGAE